MINSPEELEKIKEMIKNVRTAMLVTIDDDGCLHSRPMGTMPIESIHEIWFFTSDDSPKALIINTHHQVNLSYCDHDKNSHVSVSGKAEIVRDKQKMKELWNPMLKSWFPKGIDDPHICLLKVTPQAIQYWDYSSSILSLAGQYIKKMATGEDLNTEANKKINL